MAAALLMAAPLFSESLEPRGRVYLDDKSADFGGISGIEVYENGTRFHAVSDKGTIWRGDFTRDDGVIVAVENLEMRPILTSQGVAVEDYNIDAEEIDRDEDGNLYISFESNSRVSRFASWDAPAELIPNAEEFAGFGYNSGPEAMCIGQGGAIWLAPERSGKLDRPFPIYEYDGQSWRDDLSILRHPPYLLVSMDYDPKSARVYVLERDVRMGVLFRTRIRGFDFGSNGLENEEMLWEGGAEYGDMEGLSFYERNGARFLMIISDDNFLPILNTQILELEILD